MISKRQGEFSINDKFSKLYTLRLLKVNEFQIIFSFPFQLKAQVYLMWLCYTSTKLIYKTDNATVYSIFISGHAHKEFIDCDRFVNMNLNV